MRETLAVRSTFWRATVGFYVVLLVCGTHWPAAQLPQTLTLLDKLVHFGAYCVLACLTASAFFPGDGTGQRAFYRRAMVGLATFAALDELTQWPVPGRHPELWDWLSDLVGIAVGLGLFAWIRWHFRPRAESADADE